MPSAVRTAVLVPVALALAAGLAAGQEPAARSGLSFVVPSPLTSGDVSRIKKAVEDAKGQGADRPAVVVFDFNPDGEPAAGAEFGENYTLAKFIAGLHDLTTVAYVHGPVSKFSVLPALSCRELVVGEAARVGEVAEQPGDLNGTERSAFEELLGTTRAPHFAVVRKMVDPGVQLRRGQKNRGDFYIDLADRAAAEKAGVQVVDNAPLPFAPDGRIGVFTADQLRDLGLANAVVASRDDLAERFGLTAAGLRDDWLAGRDPVAFRYVLRGAVDAGTKEAVLRMLDRVVREKGNILFLQLECAGGDMIAAGDLANELRARADEYRVRVVAFVPDAAPDTAAVVGLGCSEIVMSKRTDVGPDAEEAVYGNFEAVLAGDGAATADAWKPNLTALADGRYPPLLVEGMIDRDLEIVRAHARTDRTRVRLMTRDGFEAVNQNGQEWVLDKTVKPKGQLLTLTATRAEDLGLARYTIDTRNPNELYVKYGVEPGTVRDATPAWLDRFAEFLKQGPVTTLLVVIAFIGLILEMKVPGTAVPGIISALCFILVFWAHTQFSGQVAVLSGLLFLLGLVLLMMEVFVLPGFGVCGITGILLMLGSLALITFGSTDGSLPQTGEEWVSFGSRMAQYMLGLVVAVFGSFFLARYLPNIPGANRLMLIPPGEKVGAEVEESALPGAALAASLLGAVGTAVTVLRPAGTVIFGDRYVDVVSEGGYVPSGSRVQVVEVEGTRIVVKEV